MAAYSQETTSIIPLYFSKDSELKQLRDVYITQTGCDQNNIWIHVHQGISTQRHRIIIPYTCSPQITDIQSIGTNELYEGIHLSYALTDEDKLRQELLFCTSGFKLEDLHNPLFRQTRRNV